jgi:hypothetical protein
MLQIPKKHKVKDIYLSSKVKKRCDIYKKQTVARWMSTKQEPQLGLLTKNYQLQPLARDTRDHSQGHQISVLRHQQILL